MRNWSVNDQQQLATNIFRAFDVAVLAIIFYVIAK